MLTIAAMNEMRMYIRGGKTTHPGAPRFGCIQASALCSGPGDDRSRPSILGSTTPGLAERVHRGLATGGRPPSPTPCSTRRCSRIPRQYTGGWHSLRDTREDPSPLGLRRRPLLLWRIPNDAHPIRKSRVESEQPPVPAFLRKNADAQRHWIQAVARRTTRPTSPRTPPSPASSAPVAFRERG